LSSIYPAITFNFIPYSFVGHVIAYWEKELGKKIGEDELEPVTWSRYQAGLDKTGADYLVALEEIQRFSRKIARWYHEGSWDLILSPTLRIYLRRNSAPFKQRLRIPWAGWTPRFPLPLLCAFKT